MPNLHNSGPDTLAELASINYDLLPACITATSGLTPPGSGLTLAAVSAQGYVRLGTALYYVSQPAISVTVSSAAGAHWLALTTDTHTAIAGWTRRAGSHVVVQANAAPPIAPGPDGTHIFAYATVAGGNITGVTPVLSPPLSRQQANAVAITGGTAVLADLDVDGNTLRVDTTNHQVLMGSATAPASNITAHIGWPKMTNYGLSFRPTDSDAGTGYAVHFYSLGGASIGSISTTASATAYNTSSDVRLKHAVQPLTGSLDLLRRLNPISHLWNATDEYAENFLAHELQRVLPYAVTGEPDAVHPDGSINPQQVDMGKCIPRMVGAIKELLAQVEALTARVASLEEQLGV